MLIFELDLAQETCSFLLLVSTSCLLCAPGEELGFGFYVLSSAQNDSWLGQGNLSTVYKFDPFELAANDSFGIPVQYYSLLLIIVDSHDL